MTEKDREQELEKIRNELGRLREELASLAAGTNEKAGSPTGSGEAHREGAGADWSDIRHTLDEARVRGERALKDLSEQIERHPVASAATAFVMGFLIARLLGGGRRS